MGIIDAHPVRKMELRAEVKTNKAPTRAWSKRGKEQDAVFLLSPTLPHPLVHAGSRSLSHIQRANFSCLGQGNQKIAAFLGEASKAFAFVAHYQYQAARQGRIPNALLCLFGSAGNPEVFLFQVFDGLRNVANLGDFDMRNRTGRAFVRCRSYMSRTLVGNNDA